MRRSQIPQAGMLGLLVAVVACTSSKRAQEDMVVFHDAQGHLLTAEELQVATGTLQYEVYDVESAPPQAKALHQQGREAGSRGKYDEALAVFTTAADLAPRWPY